MFCCEGLLFSTHNLCSYNLHNLHVCKQAEMSFDDVSFICKHKFIEDIKNDSTIEEKKCLDLIAYGQDILYVWNRRDGFINAINVKHCVRDSDLKSQVVLKPLKSILFPPDKLVLNLSSSLLALTSSAEDSSGVTVLELPERWAPDCDEIRIPSRSIAERLFFGEQLVLRQAKWHPASPSDSHLLILTSDECLRLYSATTGEVFWKCFLSKSANRLHTSIPSKISIGDTPVDFDVGLPSNDDNPSNLKWPVLILWGNGDVYCVESTIEDHRDQIPSFGPLRMFPSSDDNYGSDACSILILPTSPPIVAFSTSLGTIYNCIFLSSEEQYNGFDKSLYVVECIELELGITLTEDDDLITCPIRLVKNPIEKSMYFAVHKAGIHSVMLPLVTKLYEFLESNETVFPPYTHKSFVEYLLCTGYNRNSFLDALPILGSAFIDLSSSLFVLLNNKDLINIRVTPHFLYSTQNLEANINKREEEDSFLLHIQSLLKEHGPGPLIKLPEGEPQDMLSVIYKIKMSYKTTMEAHEIIAKKLKEKSYTLMKVFREQEKEALKIAEEQKELYRQALKIAERYGEVNEKQLSLMSRMENALRNACSDSQLSERERQATDYLENVTLRIGSLEKEIERISAANRSQGQLIGQRADGLTRRCIDLGDTRGRTVRKQLHYLTLEIASLMKRIKAIEESVPDLMLRSNFSMFSYSLNG